MKFGKAIFVLFAFFIVFSCLEARAQNTKSPKQIKILNNYGSIPFEDGKTIVAELIFTGLEAFPESEIFKALRENRTTIKTGEEFSGYKIAQAVKTIRGFLYTNGYINAQVSAFGEKLPKNQMKLDFVIDQGALARVSEIRFEGLQNFSNQELVEDLKQCSGDDWEIFDPRRLKFYLQECSRRFFQSKGFLKAKLQEPKLINIEGRYIIEIDLEEGNRYRTGEIKIAGARVFTPKEIIEILELKEGEILNSKELQNSIFKKLQRIYVDKGYVLYDAEFDPNFVEPQDDTLDGIVNLDITIDEGKLFKLAKIEFTGVETEKFEGLRKLISLADGEVYNQTKIEEGIKKINETKEFYPIEYNSRAVEVYTSIEPETERIEGSSLLRRKDIDSEATINLVIKLKKFQQ
jgi:outer membrane protein insertion porin family